MHSIYLWAFTQLHIQKKVQQFLKYVYDIKYDSQRSQGWLTYDEQYRHWTSINPTLDLGVVDAELWIRCYSWHPLQLMQF